MNFYSDLELDTIIELRNRIEQIQYELDVLYVTNADNVRKAHKVFRTLAQVEQVVMDCPMCGAERDEDGILAHSRKCLLADTLEYANDL
jgi:hypothetical protein